MKTNIAGWRTFELFYAAFLGGMFSYLLTNLKSLTGTALRGMVILIVFVLIFIFLHYKFKPPE